MEIDKALELALSAIKQFEGCKLKAYLDTGGVWTIGWGSTHYNDASSIKQGDVIDQAKADDLLSEQVKGYYITVKKMPVILTNTQIAALTSFCYNEGIRRFTTSTLYTMVIKDPHNSNIANEFLKWDYDNGKINQGLLNRRKKEAEIYFL